LQSCLLLVCVGYAAATAAAKGYVVR
jgi:hypothetical protein